MLRPGELLKLKHTDISLPGSFTFSQPFAAIRVANPKNRRQFGVDQFVLVRNPCAVQRLREVVKERNDCALWKGGRALFSRMFKQICRELRILDCHFTPASLRPGGATMYYGKGIPISTLRFMGRWIVEKSLEHYSQLAMSTQIMNRLSSSVISRPKRIAPLCLEFVVPEDLVANLRLFEVSELLQARLMLTGAPDMHSMRARHGRRVIAGGAFKGSTFEDLSHDQLVRASKRYPGDPKLQKYAKAVVAARELDGGADPLPCKPFMLRDGTVSSPEEKKPWTIKSFLWEMFRTLTLNRAVLIVVIWVALMFLLKPTLATACTKVFVRILRLALRRLTGFLLLILEGLLDEIVYQIEYTMRQALPYAMDLEQFTTAPIQFISHLLSAITGAAISSIATYIGNRQRMMHIPTVD